MVKPLIDFVALGEQTLPSVPTLRCVPLAEPHADALYLRRLEAMRSSTGEWMCFVDGGPDVVCPTFVPAMHALAQRAAAQGVPIGYAAELVRGMPGMVQEFTLRAFLSNMMLIHHGVVCNVGALHQIDWPRGTYSWEVVAYGTLAQRGFVFDPVPRYDWRPDEHGARCWPSYRTAIANSIRWLRDNT